MQEDKRDTMKKRAGKMNWAAAWAIQLAELAAGYALILWLAMALSLETGYWVFAVCLWGLMPLLGAFTAYRATVRRLLNYAAWIAPPALLWLIHYELSGYSPAAGAVLVCAFAALVGAAAGEVRAQWNKKDKRGEKDG